MWGKRYFVVWKLLKKAFHWKTSTYSRMLKSVIIICAQILQWRSRENDFAIIELLHPDIQYILSSEARLETQKKKSLLMDVNTWPNVNFRFHCQIVRIFICKVRFCRKNYEGRKLTFLRNKYHLIYYVWWLAKEDAFRNAKHANKRFLLFMRELVQRTG